MFVLRGGGRRRGSLGSRCIQAVEAADFEHVLKGGRALVQPRQARLEGRFASGGRDGLAGAGLHQQGQQLITPAKDNSYTHWAKKPVFRIRIGLDMDPDPAFNVNMDPYSDPA